MTSSLVERWRRWRRWRRLKARRWYGGEFGLLRRMSDDLINSRQRRCWAARLARERALADAEYRRRMRGGYDVQGLP